MMAPGVIIVCMATENYSMLIISLPIKVNGILINFMEKEKFIMISPLPLQMSSIIQILTISRSSGLITKVLLFLIPRKEKVDLHFRMVNTMKASFKMIVYMDKGNFTPFQVKLYTVDGEIQYL